jgi:hypothetical protein
MNFILNHDNDRNLWLRKSCMINNYLINLEVFNKVKIVVTVTYITSYFRN